MAAFNRLKEATYEIHESVKVDTQDNEDHTFCGIMFPVKCKDLLPIDRIVIRSVAVRGQLGPLSVWVSKLPEELPNAHRNATTRNNHRNNNTHGNGNTNNNESSNENATIDFRLHPKYWTKLYEAVHEPSPNQYCSLTLDEPIVLKPGQVRAIYIHSTLPGDQAIVYDNASFYMPRRGFHFGHHQFMEGNNDHGPRYSDAIINVYTGRAHVSNEAPFGQMPIWGWGNAWRDNREFVGQLEYGIVYKLWDLPCRKDFGPNFQDALFNLRLCQTRWESPLSRLPDECIFYILNMCRWDWFQDTPETMKQQYETNKLKEKEEKMQKEELENEQRKKPAEQKEANNEEQDGSGSCCSRARAACGMNDSSQKNKTDRTQDSESSDGEDDFEDALEEEEEEEQNDNRDVDEQQNNDDSDDDDDELMDEDEDDDDDSDDDSWERANGYRADHNIFRFVDPDLLRREQPEEVDEEQQRSANQGWFQRHFNRVHVLRALAQEGGGRVQILVDSDDDDDDEDDGDYEYDHDEESSVEMLNAS